MSESSAAQRIGQFAAGLALKDVPEEVVTRAKLHILDLIGLGLAATAEDFGIATLAGVTALAQAGAGAATGACSVIGSTQRLPPRDAALVNGTLVHGLDFDDTHLASIIHPSCTAFPAALALAELLDLPGSDLLTAFLAGAETGIRIGAAVQGGFHHVGYHASGVVSHFASAVTAGKLLGLTGERITAAQGITGSTASGIQVFLEEGAWTKRFHPGWGAVAGITAAYLAQSGFKGPTRPYEGKFGLFATHLHGVEPAADLAHLTARLGEEWRFGETALKPYPVCHFIHGCADAAIELHGELAAQGLSAADIVSARALLAEPTLHIIAEPAAAKQHPTSDYEAKFSAHFVTAACLIHGRFGLPDLLPEALADPAVLSLAKRIHCEADPDTRFPTFFSGGVEITLADGRRLARHIPVNSGAGERAMSAEAVVEKFHASASLARVPADAGKIAAAVLALETISARELGGLLAGE